MCKQGADNQHLRLTFIPLYLHYKSPHTHLRVSSVSISPQVIFHLSRLFHKLQSRHSYLCCFGSVEHRTFGHGNDSMVIREHQLELHDRRLKILLTVRESAAAYHHVSQARKVCLPDVNIPVVLLLHRHT